MSNYPIETFLWASEPFFEFDFIDTDDLESMVFNKTLVQEYLSDYNF